MDWIAYTGPIWVSIATVVVYYGFLFRLMRVKIRLAAQCRAKGEVFDRYTCDDPGLRAADRTQLNMLEQLPVFLLALWLHAWVVSAESATIAGAVWLGARAMYPVILGSTLDRDIPRRLWVSTGLGYAALWFMIGGIVLALVA
jgi:uncharacterized MAPEG superfamily protein